MADDSYERSTQLVPTSAVLSPISVLVVVIFRADDVVSVTRSIVAIAAAAGIHIIAMRLIRDRGNTIQGPLWESWDGNPTVQRLRWRSSTDNQIGRLHRRVQAMTGVELPTRVQESASPADADDTYADTVARLREMTRDHAKYPRVWSELQQYGAARNMYGAKPIAIVIAVAVVATCAILVGVSITGGWAVHWWLPAIAGAYAIVAGVAWVGVINPSYVRLAAERYSDALLAVPNEPGGVP